METKSSTLGHPRLEAAQLTMRYEDGLLALDHVSFRVMPGEVFVMLGGNGAGKTTTINLFLGFLEPSEGEARVDGIAVHKDPLAAKQNLAFVSENVMLYGNFTAIQNLDYFARLGGKRHYCREDYRNVLLRVGLLEEAHDRKLKGFSKGMRQKCGIAVAMLKDSPIILLDEPTSGLDPKAGYEFTQLLQSLREEGKSIFMSTHDIFRAKEVADVIAIMRDGQIAMQKPASELRDYDLVQLYMQYIAGENGQKRTTVEG